MNGAPQADALPLRDIHLPDSVPWWPPAPGWWLLLILLCLIAAIAVYYYRRRRQRLASATWQARLLLRQIREDYAAHKDTQRLIKALSSLLRRTAVSLDERRSVAAITGEDWLNYLDATLPEPGFSEGPGRVLESGPYRQQVAVDADALIDLCDSWLLHAGSEPGR